MGALQAGVRLHRAPVVVSRPAARRFAPASSGDRLARGRSNHETRYPQRAFPYREALTGILVAYFYSRVDEVDAADGAEIVDKVLPILAPIVPAYPSEQLLGGNAASG